LHIRREHHKDGVQLMLKQYTPQGKHFTGDADDGTQFLEGLPLLLNNLKINYL